MIVKFWNLIIFYKKIKQTCKQAIIEKHTNFIDKKWDYLFFDFQALIYSTYNLLSNDINYVIRLLFYIKYLLNTDISKLHSNDYPSTYKDVIVYFITKNENYFKKIFNKNYKKIIHGIYTYNKSIYDLALAVNYNNENIIIEILCENVINLVKKISDHHIKYNDTYTRTYIFFDGIPSKAKIKEQMVRRIYPEIIYYIKKDLKHTATALELDIDIKLLNDMPPSIGINKPIVIKLKQLLEEIYDSQKGKFNINELTNYGEAEHQLMLVLEQLKISNILLVSPDADLILLSIINYVKNIKIDILRISTNIIYEFDIRSYDFNINKSPFYYTFAYIFIDKILEEFNLNTKQAQLDIAYILLLLGDDFIPINPDLTINSLNDILRIYKNTNVQIIDMPNNSKNIITKGFNNAEKLKLATCNIYKLNYLNFIEFIYNLNLYKSNQQTKTFNEKFLQNEKINLGKLNKFYLYAFYKPKLQLFDKLYYLNKGIFINKHNKLELLISQKNKSEIISSSEAQIINYLEGCKFIFDLYITNNLKTYNWFYKYEVAPNLQEIYSFLKLKSVDEFDYIFDYVKKQDPTKFLSYSSYQIYIDLIKYKTKKKILINKCR